ncbi:MAG: DUF4402 domain-containing protein [Sphingomicrobium sp.]
MIRFHTLAALAAIAIASPAFAAPSPTLDSSAGAGKTVILSPLNFINDTDINFGEVVLPVGVAGSVTIDPDPTVVGFMTATGVQPLPTSVPTRGLMIGAGSAGMDVTVQTSFPTALYLGGNPLAASLPVALNVNATAVSPDTYTYTIDSGQAFQVFIGGTVGIPVNTADGAYSNTYTITATYP